MKNHKKIWCCNKCDKSFYSFTSQDCPYCKIDALEKELEQLAKHHAIVEHEVVKLRKEK